MKKTTPLYLAYGTFAVPLFWLTISLFVFLPKFYIEQGIISFSALASLAILFRVVDAVLDILIGRFVEGAKDESFSLLKRIRLMTVPLGLTTLVLFAPGYVPSFLPFSSAVLVLNGFLFLICLTTVQISYEGIIPNLVSSYSERSRLLSFRSAGILVGSLLAPLVPYVLFQYFSKSFSYLLIGVLLAFFLNLMAQINARTISYAGEKANQKHMDNVFKRVRSLLKEAPVRNLLFAFALTAAGSALPASLILFFVEHVIGSNRGPLYVAFYLIFSILSLPLWVLAAKYLEKNICWIAGILLNAGALLYIFTLGSGDEWQYAIGVLFSAAGYGATILFPASMQADVVDYDHWRFGQRREAEIASVCLFTKKTFAAVGLGLSFYLLGQQPGQAASFSSSSELFTLRVLYALVPALLSFFAVIWIIRYRLTEEELEKIQNGLEESA